MNFFLIKIFFETGRYSPVRRASEGSKSHNPGPLQEYQLLQKGLTSRNLLPSPPLGNSISLPGKRHKNIYASTKLFDRIVAGSPSHCKAIDDREIHDIEIPSDVMVNLVPGLERLVTENRITVDAANQIVITCKVPIELAQHLGLLAHSGGMEIYSAHQHLQSQSVSPIPLGYNKYNCFSSNGAFNLSGTVSPNLSSQFGVGTSQTLPPQFASNTSPVYSSFSGSSSPSTYYSAGGSSPMHQITKGISGLSAGGGSITRGTSAAFESANQPLDLTMDVTNTDNTFCPSGTSNWYVPAQFYDLKPLNLLPAQQVRIVPTPPASPNLCIIQEENSLQHPSITYQSPSFITNEDANFPHSHPQICVTDVQGDEFTLVDHGNSKDSDDSLDGQSSITLQGLIISEPSSDMPSITRGVGRKSSLEIEHKQEMYERRGSDRSDKSSLGFSDDSLSNDSNILSPGQEPSASSGFKSCDSHSDHTESRLSPDSLSECRMSDEYYELPLECSHLDSMRILEIVKQTIDSKMPPKGFVLHRVDNDGEVSVPVDISNLSLEYSGGLQIEVQVCDGRSKNNSCSKGIKLRRISGDQFEYGKLCQQLISSLTV